MTAVYASQVSICVEGSPDIAALCRPAAYVAGPRTRAELCPDSRRVGTARECSAIGPVPGRAVNSTKSMTDQYMLNALSEVDERVSSMQGETRSFIASRAASGALRAGPRVIAP